MTSERGRVSVPLNAPFSGWLKRAGEKRDNRPSADTVVFARLLYLSSVGMTRHSAALEPA